MLNAQWLETFVAVCEDGNLTRTAERLYMTQPGVSQHLKKLEDRVGTALLQRTGKTFSLTPAGEKLRDYGIRRQQQERQLLDSLFDDDPDSGTVSIACSGSFASLLYPSLLSIAKPRPDLVIALEAAPQHRIREGVIDGQFDIGVLHSAADHPRLESHHIGHEEICLVLPRDGATSVPSFDELETRGYISHPDGAGLADLLLSRNYPEQFLGADRLRVRGKINQIGQILVPVADGIGYSILPRSGVDTFASRDKLRIVSMPVPVHQDLWVVQKRNRLLGRQTEAPLRALSNIAQTLADRY